MSKRRFLKRDTLFFLYHRFDKLFLFLVDGFCANNQYRHH